MNSNSQVVWQGRLADQHTLRIERTGKEQREGVLYVLTPDGGDLLVIGGIPLPLSEPVGAEEIAVWQGIAEKGIDKVNEWRAASSPSAESDEPSWDEEETRALYEMIATHPLDTFTLKFEYSATGEGHTKCLLVVRAHTEAEALALYREHFHRGDDDASWAYWSRGVEVQRGLHREWLTGVFNSYWLDRISETLQYQRLIAFQSHFNAS